VKQHLVYLRSSHARALEIDAPVLNAGSPPKISRPGRILSTPSTEIATCRCWIGRRSSRN